MPTSTTLVIFAFTERKTGTMQTTLRIMELPPPGFKVQAEIAMAPEAPSDFAVAVHVSPKHGVVYMATKAGYLFNFDDATASMLVRTRVSQESVFISVGSELSGGIIFVNRKGEAMAVQVNETSFINYVSNSLPQLYDLYTAVLETIKEWQGYMWEAVPEKLEEMWRQIENFAGRCKKMPRQLREWPAYNELKREIEGFQQVLPPLQELGKRSIMIRHWRQVMGITGRELLIESETFKLKSLIDAQLGDYGDEAVDICESAVPPTSFLISICSRALRQFAPSPVC